MHLTKTFFKTAEIAAAIGFLWLLPAQASPVLQGTPTLLTGINGITIHGFEYNVVFEDGTCESVFTVCDEAHFQFNLFNDAMDASAALLAAIAGTYFDTNPETVGCPSLDRCISYTVYNHFLGAAEATNNYASIDIAGPSSLGLGADLSDNPSANFAVWSCASTCPEPALSIPEPGIISIFSCGLLSLAWMRRGRKNGRRTDNGKKAR